MTEKIISTIITVLLGVGAALVLYWVLNKIAELLPSKWEHSIKPYLYILPAYAAIIFYLIYPAVQTVVYSFKDSSSTELGRARQLHQPAADQRVPADAVQHAAVDDHRPGRPP